MVTMAGRAASPAAIFVALLCTAFFFARPSSADTSSSLISQTCRRTAHEGLCVSVLRSTKGTSAAVTVQDLAVAALLGAKRATLRAKLLSLDLGYEARDAAKKGQATADAGYLDLLARCDALYREFTRAGAKVVGMVSTGWYDGAADAAGALRQFPERCEALFAARRVASPMRRENAEAEVKLGVAYEIIRLLH